MLILWPPSRQYRPSIDGYSLIYSKTIYFLEGGTGRNLAIFFDRMEVINYMYTSISSKWERLASGQRYVEWEKEVMS